MARAKFVKAAAKDYPEHGIKKGESYYWWQLFKRPKQYSKTAPRQSQLTGSSFLSTVYSIEERIADLTVPETAKRTFEAVDEEHATICVHCSEDLDDHENNECSGSKEAMDDLESEVEDIKSELKSLKEEVEGNRDNMPDSLKDSDTGQLLEGRADSLQEMIDELEGIQFNTDDGPEDVLQEIQAVSYQGE